MNWGKHGKGTKRVERRQQRLKALPAGFATGASCLRLAPAPAPGPAPWPLPCLLRERVQGGVGLVLQGACGLVQLAGGLWTAGGATLRPRTGQKCVCT